MKAILVPTDFSDTANNATKFAMELAKETRSKVILFHSYHIPIPTSGEAQIYVPTPDLIEQEVNETMRIHLNQWQNMYNQEVEMESHISLGLAVDEIVVAEKEKAADLVVMGITGAGKLGEVLIGSNTIRVIEKGNVPVLIIPQGAVYRKMKHIAFACDYHRLPELGSFKWLKYFINLFGSHLYIVNIMPKEEMASYEKAVTGIRLESIFETTEHTVHFTENEDMVDGINAFSDANDIDLIVMLPRKHTLLERIFNKSHTKHMAFHTHLPLLALPE